jgi:hypothetical protein
MDKQAEAARLARHDCELGIVCDIKLGEYTARTEVVHSMKRNGVCEDSLQWVVVRSLDGQVVERGN